MGHLGLSVLTAAKHFWYSHSDVNYCSARAAAKRPASGERSHCRQCLGSPGKRSHPRLGGGSAAEKRTCSEETLTYDVKDGAQMPWARACPGRATEYGVGPSFPVLETATNGCGHPLMYGQREEETLRVAGGG